MGTTKQYLAEFELPTGKKHCQIISAPNLEDAQITSTNIAEENGWEELGIALIEVK